MTEPSTAPYRIVRVPSDARLMEEPMGSKEKFWWRDQAGQHQLFKRSRAGTGEHWSEKVASELGALLELPCARVELATWRDTPGCIVQSFLRDRSAPLVHGNE